MLSATGLLIAVRMTGKSPGREKDLGVFFIFIHILKNAGAHHDNFELERTLAPGRFLGTHVLDLICKVFIEL